MNRRCRRYMSRSCIGETIEKLKEHFGRSCRSGMSRSFRSMSKKHRSRMRRSKEWHE